MSAYYNEIDPYAAAWLRNLIEAGHLPAGDVDERSIVDVRGDDLRGYDAVHLFAGIGGWPLALRLAGLPDSFPAWTGSCPCQPFSVAGSGKGTADERHLWPAFRGLLEERRPAIVFGEQVASADGRLWLAGVRADLEALGYGVGAADLCSASVGAPHIRQRLYWVADAGHAERGQGHWPREAGGEHLLRQQWQEGATQPGEHGPDGRLADAEHSKRGAEYEEYADAYRGHRPGGSGATGGMADAYGRLTGNGELQRSRGHGQQPTDKRIAGGLADADGDRQRPGSGRVREPGERDDAGRCCEARGLGFPDGRGEPQEREGDEPGGQQQAGWGPAFVAGAGADGRDGAHDPGDRSPWADSILIPCGDGKARRIEPGLQPLAHGVPARVGRLRAYGNAIVPPLAAEFVKAAMH